MKAFQQLKYLIIISLSFYINNYAKGQVVFDNSFGFTEKLSGPNFEISDIEIKRGGISYTIDTLSTMKIKYLKEHDDLFYLIGSDSLLELKYWKNPKEILKKCNVVVAIRPGFRPSDIPAWILHRIQFANIPRFEISSSNIRMRWRENKTIRYLVTLPVWEYINKHNLYS